MQLRLSSPGVPGHDVHSAQVIHGQAVHPRQQSVPAAGDMATRPDRIAATGGQGLVEPIQQRAIHGPVFTSGIDKEGIALWIEPGLAQRGHVDDGPGVAAVDEILITVPARGDPHVSAVGVDGGRQTASHLVRMRRDVHRLQVGREPAAVESLAIAEDDGAATTPRD
jgi:hypothetical protein